MLARNFLSPLDLGITDKEHTALVGVLGMLERGELSHAHMGQPLCYSSIDELRKPAAGETRLFNMLQFVSQQGCSTVCCLAGHCDAKFGTQFTNPPNSRQHPHALSDLFMTYHHVHGMPQRYSSLMRTSTTVDQAAQALRNYLSTGAARWDEVLA